jgi:hypothetical protein
MEMSIFIGFILWQKYFFKIKIFLLIFLFMLRAYPKKSLSNLYVLICIFDLIIYLNFQIEIEAKN